MRQKRISSLLVGLILLLLLSLQASAATVYGTIYDFSLKQTENVRVSINTTPQQQLIAVNGRYSFNVAPGDYTIYVEQLGFGKIVSTASEEITIKDEGSYIRDIILFPYFEEEIFNESDALTVEDVSQDRDETNTAIIILLVFIVLLLMFILFRMKKVMTSLKRALFSKEHKEEKHKEEKKKDPKESETLPKDLQEIVDFITSQENRVTQKDIRKQFPKSEAKISLLIADLEKRGLVEKVKRGRGNIIILK